MIINFEYLDQDSRGIWYASHSFEEGDTYVIDFDNREVYKKTKENTEEVDRKQHDFYVKKYPNLCICDKCKKV